jgi:hypothetical protein
VLPVIVARWLMPGIYIIVPAADESLKMDAKKRENANGDSVPVITDKEGSRVRCFSTIPGFAP